MGGGGGRKRRKNKIIKCVPIKLCLLKKKPEGKRHILNYEFRECSVFYWMCGVTPKVRLFIDKILNLKSSLKKDSWLI